MIFAIKKANVCKYIRYALNTNGNNENECSCTKVNINALISNICNGYNEKSRTCENGKNQ